MVYFNIKLQDILRLVKQSQSLFCSFDYHSVEVTSMKFKTKLKDVNSVHSETKTRDWRGESLPSISIKVSRH